LPLSSPLSIAALAQNVLCVRPEQVRHREGLTVASTSAEHTIFKVSEQTAVSTPLQLGERVMMVPFYSDATMLLHREAYAVRNGLVEVRLGTHTKTILERLFDHTERRQATSLAYADIVTRGVL
jgi:hypothetical protein